MKILTPILIFFVFFICLSCTLKSENISAKSDLPTNNFNLNNSSTEYNAAKAEQSEHNETNSQNESYRIVPKEFKQIDFRNYSYSYKFYDGRKANIALKDSEFEYDFKVDRGWFTLSDVYYVDLTNDANPEAIVFLSHVSCGTGSCDGGAGLFYIYTTRENKLKSIWKFETGSLAYGCGLKSFTIKNKKINIELFGKCSNGSNENEQTGKFQVKDLTHLQFAYNGTKFIEEKKEFISTRETDVKNYKEEISIEP